MWTGRMHPMNERISEQWMRLRHTGVGDGSIEVPSLPTDVDTGFGPVRLAIGSNGQPRLMVPCAGPTSFKRDISSDKLAVTISRYEVAGRSTQFIDVMCNDRALDTVFAELAGEVVNRISAGGGAMASVEGTISDFRELLLGAEEAEVSDSEIVGLIGELVVLRELSARSGSAISAWTGPFDQRHDFRRSVHAIEVKTSSRADSTSILVSSVEQLAEPAGGTLLLVHLNIERAGSGPLSVSALCSEIVSLGVPRDELQKALSALGCQDPNAQQWNRLRFTLERISGYRVGMGFPRVTSSQFPGHVLPEGIGAISYELDLRAASRFRVQDGELGEEFSKVAP